MSALKSGNTARNENLTFLFGGSKTWKPTQWRTTDDRLRGGASQSHLTLNDDNSVRFHGTLDITTLGGAGFASQFSPSPSLSLSSSSTSSPNFFAPTEVDQDGFWNLSTYDGIMLAYCNGDGKMYTLILKDSTPVPASLSSPDTNKPRTDGRERAGISWEVTFTASAPSSCDDEGLEKVKLEFFPWRAFRATYRGKDVEGCGEVKKGEVRKVGFMMRSGFGKQEGGFSVVLGWIGAAREGNGVNEEVGREKGREAADL